jgi:serine/threonine-protein kinase
VSDARLALHLLGDDAKPCLLPESGMLVVGSSADRAGLRVEGQGVDDAHCAVGPVKGGGWAIKDLGSRYGTILNGKKVAAARLSEGDTILLGSRRLRVIDPRNPEGPAAPSEPAASAAPQAAPPAQSAAPADAPERAGAGKSGVGIPKRIGGYRIDRLLGRGAMGTVLLAEQESLHRPVALKLLPPRLAADHSFVQRFQKEARAAAALNHPNVVVVHDVGEADGFHFLSMEYMERGSLEDRLRSDGKLPWREVLDVLHDAAGGLMFAEGKRIIHRDIKPANLMQNAAGTIKIADLGLATTLEAEASESEGRKILGTPHFIAPEQARGEAIDHRADLYSLGATAYHLLTGHTPFEGETTRDILRGHLTVEPEPLRTHVPQIPAGLDELVLRCLAKDPDARPQSADVLLAEVDRLRLEADHGVAVAAGGGGKSSKLPLLLGGAVVIAGLAGYLVLGGGEPEEPGPQRGGNAASAADGPAPNDLLPAEGDEGLLGGPLDPGAANGGGAAAEELEATLRERNLLAENAYLRIDASLSKADRAAMLADLGAQYPGTDTAARAEEELATLRAEIAARSSAERKLVAALATAESRLRAAAAMPTPAEELPRPGDQLRAVRAFPTPAGLDPAAMEGLVGRVEDEIVAAARERFAAELARAEALADDGRFDEVQGALEDLLPRLDLPEYEPGAEPEGLEQLELQAGAARGRLNRLPSERRTWREHRSRADRTAIAAALRGDGALRAALAELDLDAALAALAELETGLGTADGRAFVEREREELQTAQDAIASLAEEFRHDGWRRRTVVDPRGGRSTARDAVGLDAEGLHVDVKGDAEVVPWSVMARSTDAMVQLFKERLQRDYTPREKRGAAALLRVTCGVAAADLAAQMLDPEAQANFSEAEAERMRELYALPEAWVQTDARFAREHKAGGVLATALRDVENGVWSAAEAGLALLLDEYADTLLVALVSDGAEWRADDDAQAEPGTPAAPDVPTADADGGDEDE